jgi:hypothetical protein|tara:strand:+ start:72 stop:359 length:288 start_codon:yes stop_codon:yes gene_type:complete
MLKHIVLFKLAKKTPQNLENAVSSLKSLDGNIETLRFIEVGIDFKGSERSYDIALTTYFDNKEGLEAYAKHPNHLPVVAVMQELCSQRVVVDYEL